MILNLFKLIAALSISLFVCSQDGNRQIKTSATGNDSLFAAFNHKSSDGYGWISIQLKYNKTFNYLSGTDVQQVFSHGTWEFKKDTLILSSDLDKNNLPLFLKEFKTKKKDSLYIGWVKDLNNDVVKDATFFYNDTIETCMPVFDECSFYKGTVKRIKAVFSNNASSDWIAISDTSVTYIEPILGLNFSIDKYVFLSNKKFLLTKKGLYGLNETKRKVKGKDKIIFIKDASDFYERMK